VDDYQKRSDELKRLQRQELERRSKEWDQELKALNEQQRGERRELQQELAAEDRRLRNRLLDPLAPGRKQTRHEIARTALDRAHATERDHIHHQALQEREATNARYDQHRKQLDTQERRRLEAREAKRVREADRQRQAVEEKRELFARYYPVRPAPERERDRQRDDPDRER
jgi:hypothetical protein